MRCAAGVGSLRWAPPRRPPMPLRSSQAAAPPSCRWLWSSVWIHRSGSSVHLRRDTWLIPRFRPPRTHLLRPLAHRCSWDPKFLSLWHKCPRVLCRPVQTGHRWVPCRQAPKRLHPVRGSDSRSRGAESHALPTEPAGHFGRVLRSEKTCGIAFQGGWTIFPDHPACLYSTG